MNNIDEMPQKCHDCPYWEIAEKPYVCCDCRKEYNEMDTVKIEFTKEEFDKIIEFMDGGEYETVQQAIMAAVENAE